MTYIVEIDRVLHIDNGPEHAKWLISISHKSAKSIRLYREVALSELVQVEEPSQDELGSIQ